MGGGPITETLLMAVFEPELLGAFAATALDPWFVLATRAPVLPDEFSRLFPRCGGLAALALRGGLGLDVPPILPVNPELEWQLWRDDTDGRPGLPEPALGGCRKPAAPCPFGVVTRFRRDSGLPGLVEGRLPPGLTCPDGGDWRFPCGFGGPHLDKLFPLAKPLGFGLTCLLAVGRGLVVFRAAGGACVRGGLADVRRTPAPGAPLPAYEALAAEAGRPYEVTGVGAAVARAGGRAFGTRPPEPTFSLTCGGPPRRPEGIVGLGTDEGCAGRWPGNAGLGGISDCGAMQGAG